MLHQGLDSVADMVPADWQEQVDVLQALVKCLKNMITLWEISHGILPWKTHVKIQVFYYGKHMVEYQGADTVPGYSLVSLPIYWGQYNTWVFPVPAFSRCFTIPSKSILPLYFTCIIQFFGNSIHSKYSQSPTLYGINCTAPIAAPLANSQGVPYHGVDCMAVC